MVTFDITKVTPEMRKEIAACNNAEELQAYLASKNLVVPGSKPDAIFKLCGKMDALDFDELAKVSGGGCNDDCNNFYDS